MTDEKTSVHPMVELAGVARQQSAYLIVINAKSVAALGQMVKLDRAECVLGRSSDAELQVEDDGISRRHAKIQRAPTGGYQLVDLGSTNGTWLNGTKISVAQLRDGDKIQIGSNTILKFSIQDQLEEQFQRNIYESATRDGLTRLFNKKYFLDSLAKEFAYCLRHRVPLALVMLDVDHFKKLNDTYGHLAGDHVLSRIALRLSETIRLEDVLARYGGEEFALMLRESDEDKALVCAERCRRAVEEAEFSFGGSPIRATISLGVATLFDGDYAGSAQLIEAADRCLYWAKKSGRNRVGSQRLCQSQPTAE